MDTLFIINPISGKGEKPKIVKALQDAGYRTALTEYAGHGEILAREANEDIVVAVGGDGTVNEVARGLIGTGKTFGIIPCGSGDGLARSLGISHHLQKALKTIKGGKTHPLDVGYVNGKPFFSVCGVGFDADVSKMFALSGKRGVTTYIEKAMELWKSYKPYRFTINIDGNEWTQDAVLITVGNSNQWGNEAKVTPHADCGDGLLDITVLDMFHTIELPHLAARLMTGLCDTCRQVHCYTGKHIVITREEKGAAHFDGDWFDAGKVLDINIMPSQLKILVP